MGGKNAVLSSFLENYIIILLSENSQCQTYLSATSYFPPALVNFNQIYLEMPIFHILQLYDYFNTL